MQIDVEKLSTITAAEDHGKDIASALEDKAGVVIAADLDAALNKLATILATTVASLQAIAEKAVADINATIAGLDGWTVTNTLRKPKE